MVDIVETMVEVLKVEVVLAEHMEVGTVEKIVEDLSEDMVVEQLVAVEEVALATAMVVTMVLEVLMGVDIELVVGVAKMAASVDTTPKKNYLALCNNNSTINNKNACMRMLINYLTIVL